jgi:D-sedoheptulose 7-phosphate isomerase
MEKQEYIKQYLQETEKIAQAIDQNQILAVVDIVSAIKEKNGRIFFAGVGGGAGTGSHSANDFNKMAKIATICLTDNVSLLTALANDEGWESIFSRQMQMHNFDSNDCLFIYSVGGGSETTSKNLVAAIDYAKQKQAKVIGVVGKDTGHTAKMADACIIVPTIDQTRITAHTEDWQMIVDHLIVNLLSS